VPADQMAGFVDILFKSAGDRKELYRVELKKALSDNLGNLELMKQGNLIKAPLASNPIVSMITAVLNDSKSGLVPKTELQEAITKVVKEKNLDLNKKEVKNMVDSFYIGGANKKSRKELRKALEDSS
jgi:hypothetical protein